MSTKQTCKEDALGWLRGWSIFYAHVRKEWDLELFSLEEAQAGSHQCLQIHNRGNEEKGARTNEHNLKCEFLPKHKTCETLEQGAQRVCGISVPWRYSKPSWTGPWASCFSWPCLSRGLNQMIKGWLPTSTILILRCLVQFNLQLRIFKIQT